MNIGILSQPLRHNYGGTLQNYALSQILKTLGHKPITINWGRSTSWIKWIIRNSINILTQKTLSENPYKMSQVDKNFLRFHKKYISTTLPMGVIKPKKILRYHLDYYIVGSDQVWRKDYNANIEYMYFSFLPDKIGRLSYAASIGIDYWDYSKELTEACKKYLTRFDAVTVRENSAISLLTDNLGIRAKLVLDPTLLMKLQDYEKYLNLCKRSSISIIAVYILDVTIDKIRLIREIGEKINLPIEVIGNSVYKGNFQKRDKRIYPSIESWLETIRDAQYLITDSFHGIAFAINFHKKFITLGNECRGNTRFNSLLELFGLQNKLINNSMSVNNITNELKSEVAWERIEMIRDEMLNLSINMLKDQIR